MAAALSATTGTNKTDSGSSNGPKSPHRQNGFNVSQYSNDESNPNQQYLSRSRTTTSSTVTLREHALGMSASHKPATMNNGYGDAEHGGDSIDNDVEMDDVDKAATPSIQPLPIPKSADSVYEAKGSSQTPSDVSTPPDALLSASHRSASVKTTSSHPLSSMRLPSIHALSPGLSTSHGTSSAQWSPSRSSDPHLYSISNGHGSYPYSSVRPYLSTSFKTSAERSGFSQMDDRKQEEEDENDEDVFGNTSSVLGLRSTPGYNGRPRGRASQGGANVDGEGEGGDASGVFSFSSPYLRSQAMNDDVPGMPPSPPDGHNGSAPTPSSASSQGAPPDRVLSPSWTARSLQQMSLGGGVEMTASSSMGSTSGGGSSSLIGAARRHERSSRPSHMHHPHSYAHSHSAFSRSLPSSAMNVPQGRRLSSGRLARPIMPPASMSAYSVSPGGAATYGSATLYSRSPSSNSPYARSPGTPAGFGSSMRPSPYHSTSGRVPTTFAMETPSHRERSRSRQRWAVPRGAPINQADEDEDDEDDDDETDDEMMITGQVDVDEDDSRLARSREPVLLARGHPAQHSLPNHVIPAGSGFAQSARAHLANGMTRPPPAAAETVDDGTGAAPDEMTEVAAIRDRLGGAANCAAFIAKLWFLVTRPSRYGRFLHWNAAGNTVILSTDPDLSNEFAADVLPRLWNHANYSSFIRQMNLYGFQRLPSSRILDKAEIQAAVEKGLKGPDGQSPTELSTAQQLYGSHSSFLHPKFVQGREDLLPLLKPRNAKKPKAGSGEKKDEDD
ncbi:unnamed protein product [Sympodiomycopsis kandeliae]